jgi:hypothetical protein
MAISYSRPLSLGWDRMKRFLFQPFDLGRWMVLGFTAWLAGLADGNGGGNEGLRISRDIDDDGVGGFLEGVRDGVAEFFAHDIAVLLVVGIVIAALVIGVLVLWLSSRGRFMFLDNLVHRRTEVAAPWSAYAAQADSLFLWRLGWTLVVLVVVGLLVAGFAFVALPLSVVDVPTALGLPVAIGLGILLFVAIVAISYVEYFLDLFVAPLMYRHRLSATAAWALFLDLFQRHPGPFFLMGLLTAGIHLVLGLVFVLGGILTCCLGLLLMAIPYLGTVVTLPIPVTLVYMNLEFLGQFGDDFRLLAPGDPGPPPPAGGSFDDPVDRTVVRPHDVGEDPGGDEPGPQAP